MLSPQQSCLIQPVAFQNSFRDKNSIIKKARTDTVQAFFVGVAGFEPAASTSQTWRDNRATLHPEKRAVLFHSKFKKFQVQGFYQIRPGTGGVYPEFNSGLHPD